MNYAERKQRSYKKKFVNAHQTKETRQKTYCYLRLLGLSSQLARRLRDWRMSYISRYVEQLEQKS